VNASTGRLEPFIESEVVIEVPIERRGRVRGREVAAAVAEAESSLRYEEHFRGMIDFDIPKHTDCLILQEPIEPG
jgi:outer membrane receptor for ferric coprogen and ferric-rhodotorulic acid